MKLSSSVIGLISLAVGNAQQISVAPYQGTATAQISNNVNWSSQDASYVVDGDLSDVASKAVSYTSDTCDIAADDLGYVTVDLGSSQSINGVRVYMHSGDGRKYCNVIVDVWDDGEPEPSGPSITVAPTPTPTSNPTEAVVAIQEHKPLGPTRCYVCDGGILCAMGAVPAVTCEREDQAYCMTTVEIPHGGGGRHVTRKCATETEVREKWLEQSSDKGACVNYDMYATQPLLCMYGCVGDLCNDAKGSNGFSPRKETLYNGRRKRRLEEASVYSSGTDHKFGPEANPLDVIFNFSQFVRYIRVWAGHNSVDNEVRFLEIQPLIVVTPVPVATLAGPIPASGKASGDPHFTTLGGEKFDFHGGCDLVLIKNPNFGHKLGMNIHIRTTITTWWSSIQVAALQIGDSVLEVTGGDNGGKYWLNGEEGKEPQDGDYLEIAGFPIHFRKTSSKKMKFRIDLGHGDVISLETFKSFVTVNIRATNPEQFEDALGLLGSYPSGKKVARDHSTVMTDADEFGKEWQVRMEEPILFHSIEGTVQFPMECAMPDTRKSTKRRLGESRVTKEDASVACARASLDERDDCVFDVLATNDKEMAGSY